MAIHDNKLILMNLIIKKISKTLQIIKFKSVKDLNG
jgi:hypothetical protein